MNKRILVIEDDAALSNIYALVLGAHGFETQVAGNGREALEKLQSFAPDVILLDLLMPQMDGVSFLQAFGHDPKVRPTPRIIVFSNLFDSHKEHEVKSLGAVDIVLKANITPSGLVELVTTHFAEL